MDIGLQLQLTTSPAVDTGNAVLFDTIIYSSGDINYSPISGVITLNETGKYVIHWWLATHTAPTTSGLTFSLNSSQGDVLIGASPVKTGEMYGMGLIEVTAAPVTLTLTNSTSQTVYLSDDVTSQGMLMLTQVPPTPQEVAYGGIYEDGPQVITLTAGTPEVVSLTELSPSANVGVASDILTIQISGRYRVDFMVLLESTTGDLGLDVAVRINGGYPASALFTSTVVSAVFQYINVGGIVELTVGDTLELTVSSAIGGSLLFGPNLNASLNVQFLGTP